MNSANEYRPIARVVDLIDTTENFLFNVSYEEAAAAVASGDPDRVRAIDGQFAILQHQGQTVRMARSIGRPMRYFLAKQEAGPCLVVAERIDEIQAFLQQEGMGDQFRPAYTRMVPAHHIVEIALVGCPDPNPVYRRFLDPPKDDLPAEVGEIGRIYMETIADECRNWLNSIPSQEPIGVLFSGGIDSGAVLLIIHHLLLERGESPARLKAFTLSIEGGSPDTQQAVEFLGALDMSMFLEVIEVGIDELDFAEAVRVIEDYKPLDVQAATMGIALCAGIRKRYPDWVYLIDGDGGDENLKDYPIEENPELTIRSVLNNLMLYHEGWGVDAIKHSLTYSGGQSRGHVRSYAPGRLYGFRGFSPYALPNVIAVSESIPFVELTNWSHDRLYALKGEIVRRGVERLTGKTMPVFEKRRFQHGALETAQFNTLFPEAESDYRDIFERNYD